jgi:hypothetical protein
MWDRQVYWITMKNWNPPTTIGEPPQANIRAFLELLVGLVLLVLSAIIWREGQRRGIRYHKYDPFMFLAEQSHRSWKVLHNSDGNRSRLFLGNEKAQFSRDVPATSRAAPVWVSSLSRYSPSM